MLCLQGISWHLGGYRGSEEAIDDQYRTYVMKNPDISEMDLNPVFLYPDGYMVVDATHNPG